MAATVGAIVLAVLSEVMSDHEQYGMTCRGRIKAVEVLTCTRMDQRPVWRMAPDRGSGRAPGGR